MRTETRRRRGTGAEGWEEFYPLENRLIPQPLRRFPLVIPGAFAGNGPHGIAEGEAHRLDDCHARPGGSGRVPRPRPAAPPRERGEAPPEPGRGADRGGGGVGGSTAVRGGPGRV